MNKLNLKAGDCFRDGVIYMRVDSVSPLRYTCINFWDSGIIVYESNKKTILTSYPTEVDVDSMIEYSKEIAKDIFFEVTAHDYAKERVKIWKGEIISIHEKGKYYLVECRNDQVEDTLTGPYLKYDDNGFTFGYGTFDLYQHYSNNIVDLPRKLWVLPRFNYLKICKMCERAQEYLQVTYNC